MSGVWGMCVSEGYVGAYEYVGSKCGVLGYEYAWCKCGVLVYEYVRCECVGLREDIHG